MRVAQVTVKASFPIAQRRPSHVGEICSDCGHSFPNLITFPGMRDGDSPRCAGCFGIYLEPFIKVWFPRKS